MKFTYNWLKSFIDIDLSPDSLSDILSSIGLEVEQITDKNAIYSQFILAKIIDTEPHPNADKLTICKINNGKEVLQIVCGAKNVKNGMKVVLAPIGSIIPANNFQIKESVIRGVKSQGMLCSEEELLLSQNSEGIIEIESDDDKIGTTFANFMLLNDTAIDLSITPNRGDCTSIMGIARDLGAALNKNLTDYYHNFYKNKLTFNSDNNNSFILDNKKYCQEIAFCEIKNVDNTVVSEKKIQSLFKLIGVKSHSPLVDISNFCMYQFGRPNHMYDLDKISGKVTVRLSKDGENFLSLEEKSYKLPDGILVISDEKKILSIAGVIGGFESKVDHNTKNILIEVGNFEPTIVSNAVRTLDIRTESSFRFERRVDFGNTPFFMHYITDLVQKTCNGNLINSTLLSGEKLEYIECFKIDYNIINKILGTEISPNEINNYLKLLGFEQENEIIKIPSWRQGDIENNADIAEEVIRFFGIGICDKKSLDSKSDKSKSPQNYIDIFKTSLLSRNIYETITWSFIKDDYAKLFLDTTNLVYIKNPISNEFGVMRPNLLPGLLKALKTNISNGIKSISFFEEGKIFYKNNDQIVEKNTLGIVRTGNATDKGVFTKERKFDFYDIKDDVLNILSELNISEKDLIIKKDTPSYYHPGKSAALYLGKRLIALLGEIHPEISKKLDIKNTVYASEILYEDLPNKNMDKRSLFISPELQSINRDFAFFIKSDTESKEVIQAIRSLKNPLITDIKIFDIYHNTQQDINKKSIAFKITIQPKLKTLVTEEIEDISNQVITCITDKLGAELRVDN
ncbi:MAG: phenylalanyl-tRNA synthetase beta chain [Candidatus Midichloriaceae bacterium]|jgi:phenylalanyl-tRNA synthetase beta chain